MDLEVKVGDFNAEGKAVSEKLLHGSRIKGLLEQYDIVFIKNDNYNPEMDYSHVISDREKFGEKFDPRLRLRSQFSWHRDYEDNNGQWYPLDAVVIHAIDNRPSKTVFTTEEQAVRDVGYLLDFLSVQRARESCVEELQKASKGNLWNKKQGGKFFQIAKGVIEQYNYLTLDEQIKALNVTTAALDRILALDEDLVDLWRELAQQAPITLQYNKGDTAIFKPYIIHGKYTPRGQQDGLIRRSTVDFRRLN